MPYLEYYLYTNLGTLTWSREFKANVVIRALLRVPFSIKRYVLLRLESAVYSEYGIRSRTCSYTELCEVRPNHPECTNPECVTPHYPEPGLCSGWNTWVHLKPKQALQMFSSPFSTFFEFEFMNEWTFECWMECWMNVCKPENSSYETHNFSSSISSNMQKKYWMKCWTGFLWPLCTRTELPNKG